MMALVATMMAIVGGALWLSFGVLAVVDADGTRIGVLPRVGLLVVTVVFQSPLQRYRDCPGEPVFHSVYVCSSSSRGYHYQSLICS